MTFEGWLAALRSRAVQPPLAVRVPLWWGDSAIGSVEPSFFGNVFSAAAIGEGRWVQSVIRDGVGGWQVNGELTATLAQIAFAMRDAGAAHAWRGEQLAVHDASGNVVGTIERACVRPLGIPTFAVHLVGKSADGRHWVQQRSLTKPNDPGLWDTLVGGMVPASDSVVQALERETWEEAGLRFDQVTGLAYGGRITTQRPSGDGHGPRETRNAGYVVEQIDWYRCTLPDGVVPTNQDGEVAQFAAMAEGELVGRLVRDEFTTEAALILVAAGLTHG